MPLSLAKLREKAPRALSQRQNARKQRHLLLPPSVTDSCRIALFFTRSPDSASTISTSIARSTSDGGDVPEHTADPVVPIIVSVISSIQTSMEPPQGKALSMKFITDGPIFPPYNCPC